MSDQKDDRTDDLQDSNPDKPGETQPPEGQQTTPPPSPPVEATQELAPAEPVEGLEEFRNLPTAREGSPTQVQALDQLDGAEADELVGDEVESEAGVNPEGFEASPKDFPWPKEDTQ